MNVLFDTSVLVAALIEDHPTHSQSLSWLELVGAGSPTISDTNRQSHKPAPSPPSIPKYRQNIAFLGFFHGVGAGFRDCGFLPEMVGEPAPTRFFGESA